MEEESTLEYVADAEDEEWHRTSRFGGDSADEVDGDGEPRLPLRLMEKMIDILEKLTGFETIITTDQAEKALVKRIPELALRFPAKNRSGGATIKQVVQEIYSYWVQKRSKLKRPLLRRFWPVTASDDTNPHLVFRPREKEKYKLRKKRQNDMDAFRKMKQLRQDFNKVRILLDLVCRRERLNACMVQMQAKWFKHKMFDIVDTSDSAGPKDSVKREDVEKLLDVPSYFDVSSIGATGHKKKRRRRTGEFDGSRASSPGAGSSRMYDVDGSISRSSVAPAVIAGQNHGEPAPLFLHPLRSRESFVSSWDTAVPFVTNYVDSHPTPTFRFRHRPRIGRGGRLCIDRLPHPPHPDIVPVTVFTAGEGLPRSVEPQGRLLDLMPTPLDRAALSRRIEEICAGALKEDLDNAAATTTAVDGDENDCDEVVVKVEDWLNTDDQLWGNERFAIGPI